MSHKLRTLSNGDTAPCEKYLNKIFRQEAFLANNKKATTPRSFQDKFSHLSKSPLQSQRTKPRTHMKSQSPIQKMTASVVSSVQKEHFESMSAVKELPVKTSRREQSKSPLPKSPTRARSNSKLREGWGQLLKSNRSKEKVSNFSNFDPLRTLHFLSRELFTKLQDVLPDEDEVLQMVSDIRHALKRIPPEVSSLLHNPQVEYAQSEISGYTPKSMSTKTCQTPPTLYQEDTDRFKKIMAENTYRLEVSCKQLEEVCASLQNEKELTEKELEEAKENVEVLCKKVKELEEEIESMSEMKLKQLEEEKRDLQNQLSKALEELDNNPKLVNLTKLVDELKNQKRSSEESFSMLQYDMTILKMEKEKVVTMLAVRDKEIEQIQSEMAKIQEHVNHQLKKLNSDTLQRANSMKTLSDQFSGIPDNMFLDIGDTTVSSIATNGIEKQINVIKESPCGDTNGSTKSKDSEEDVPNKLTADNVELDLASANQDDNKDEEAVLETLIKGFTPSMQAFLKTQNI